MDAEITLVDLKQTKNDYGVLVETSTSRDVMCQDSSITRSEFFGAGRNGLTPEFMVTVFRGDYHGERACIFKGKPYTIYRTYLPPGSDYIELYCKVRGGTNNITK